MALAFTSTSTPTPRHLPLVVVVLLLSIFSPICFGKCHKDDEAGLLGFKSGITEDPEGMLSSWIPGTDCCKWSNVNCFNANNKRVTQLVLYGSNPVFFPNSYLTGTISPSLLKVGQLTQLYLRNLRNLTGPLPKGLFDLPMLKQVYIEDNKLSGPLSLSKSPKSNRLELLVLDDNKFSGGIPHGIQCLRNLTTLSLRNNRFSGGIPNIFKSLAFKELHLSHNKFFGEIPPSFSFLAPQLEIFNASHNTLTGKIPKYLKNFNKLEKLDLSYNRLSGQIPTTKFSPESFVGNDHLCGSPLPPCRK
ncbi:hypothetical protein AQUCO_05800149v1 [Aquilegia coerulea]|uniref:Leucine-rich repeat-containing N-terminal plant-type domain-containing protein n=1 Tax=Aquilegia coerulea TaxID=218851 RepID=A0A2G5CF44_AQUCA|nr:hypothetical protein AQUCO_05800149v1 [Aquilegia coerulea]